MSPTPICGRLTQAFLAVYSPVWVDRFSPPEKQTAWLSYLQASTPLGVMLGYVAATAAVWYKQTAGSCGPFACWRFPFALQVVLVAPLCVGMWFVPTRHVDIAFAIEVADPAEEEGSLDMEGEDSEFPSIFGDQDELLTSAPPSAEKAKVKAAAEAAIGEDALFERGQVGEEKEDEEEKGGGFIPITRDPNMVTPVKQRPPSEGSGAAPERAVTFGSFTSAQGSLASDGIVFAGRLGAEDEEGRENKKMLSGAAVAFTAMGARQTLPRVSQTPSPGFGQAHQPKRKVQYMQCSLLRSLIWLLSPTLMSFFPHFSAIAAASPYWWFLQLVSLSPPLDADRYWYDCNTVSSSAFCLLLWSWKSFWLCQCRCRLSASLSAYTSAQCNHGV